MKKFVLGLVALYFLISLPSCDHVDNPYPNLPTIELDTTLYPGNWSDYVANEWPQFTANLNMNRNVLIEDFTGHQCVYCPAAADLAHALHGANPSRVYVSSIHAGPTGIGDFQLVSPPEYPVDFTNPQGIEIGTYFGTNDGGFSGNPRGTINRFNNGFIFQSPNSWTSMVNTQLTENNLRVNIQSDLNYFRRVLTANDMINGKYYVNYSFVVPNQLDGAYNAENMHVLIYVYDRTTWEIYQVIKQKIIP